MTEKSSVIGTALVINDLVAYQPGAVVSRTIIDKGVGTVTAFAFDEEQGLSEHTAPFDAMVQITDGAADITIEESVHSLKAGEMIIMPANRRDSVKSNSRFKMMLIMIRK